MLPQLARHALRFELLYEFPDGRLRSESTLRFWTRQEIERHLESARLRVVGVFGDWKGGPFDPQQSEEMIFVIEAAGQRERGRS
jgi:hypothetical protein